MLKPVSIALAAGIAISSLGMTAAPAKANDTGAALAIFGAIAGAAALSHAYNHHGYYNNGYGYRGYYAPPPPRPYYRYHRGYNNYYGGGSAHVNWCLNRYRTYNPATNTYFRKPGVPAVCHSPYG
jgi:hypothetical protein